MVKNVTKVRDCTIGPTIKDRDCFYQIEGWYGEWSRWDTHYRDHQRKIAFRARSGFFKGTYYRFGFKVV
jgi:hypothetical protein